MEMDELDKKIEEMTTDAPTNYGFVEPQIEDDQYILGGLTSLPKKVLQSDGNWQPYFPTYEPQFGGNWDTYGCTVWGTENAIEIILKRITGWDDNFSERYVYNGVEIDPPGSDPHLVAEWIRKNGLVDQEVLPMTDTYEKFTTPRPMWDKYIREGQKWPYTLKHEWLWTNSQAKTDRILKIREALQYSPLGVSVTAWFEEGGVYVDRGQPNTHWCVLGGETREGWVVFDSYDQSVKILSFDHNIKFAKRYYLEPKSQGQESLFSRIIKLFKW